MDNIYHAKLVLLGDKGVGKTSIINRFIFNKFNYNLPSTFAAGYHSKIIDLPDLSTTINFKIWDTAGQEQYHSMASLYYKEALAVIIVYDVTDPNTFKGAKQWLNEVKSIVKNDILLILVGNKLDLTEKTELDMQEIREYSEIHKLAYFLVSAKEDINISGVFTYIAQQIDKRLVDNIILSNKSDTYTNLSEKSLINLHKLSILKCQSKKKCCL